LVRWETVLIILSPHYFASLFRRLFLPSPYPKCVFNHLADAPMLQSREAFLAAELATRLWPNFFPVTALTFGSK
jgi:hypothetical protein